MDSETIPYIITTLDILIAIFIMLTGIFVILFGMTWSNYIDTITPGILKDWLTNTPWILNFTGIATILYGIKRFLQNFSTTE